jgi:lipopolysaccharide transport protein LptA
MGTRLTVATHTAGVGTHAWRASGPRDLSRLIRDARRHSARVRFLRIGVPAVTLAGLGIVALLTWFNPLALRDLPVTAGRVIVSGTKITMEAPKLAGFTRDNRAYNITAEAAAQDFTDPTVLELTGIHGKIEMQSKGAVDVTAVAGLYNTKSELLTLTQYVVVMSSDGYEAHLTEATVDTHQGLIVSEKPVEVLLPNGKLNANRMEVVDNGALLRFDRGAILDLAPAAPGPADKKTPRPSGALQGFSTNRDKPVHITSTTLEVRDKEKKASFIGNVLATQGDTTMKSKALDVYYDQDGDTADASSPGRAAGPQQIRRLEATSVVVTQRDQTASGETGVFDMRSNMVTLATNVVITQGPQVIRGDHLTADLTSGVSHVEGRVSALVIPNDQPKAGNAKGGDAKAGQPMSGPSNALQGFSVNRDQPIQITSTTLDVRDKEKKATFVGNVVVAQGDTTMKSKTLDVYYDQEGNPADAKMAQAGSGEQQIRRLEAKGGVVVTKKDQTATGETGVFEMQTNTVTLIGNVVATQGPQVIRGERLTVDLTTGVSHVEGRVQGLFLPNSRPKGGEPRARNGQSEESNEADTASSGAKPETGRGKETSKPSAKPPQPLKLN